MDCAPAIHGQTATPAQIVAAEQDTVFGVLKDGRMKWKKISVSKDNMNYSERVSTSGTEIKNTVVKNDGGSIL